MKTSASNCYLFASNSSALEISAATVFCNVKGESFGRSLCSLLTREYSGSAGPYFHYRAIANFSLEERVLLEESIDWLTVHNDPDPGIYDPAPSEEMLLRAQYAVRVRGWEAYLEGTSVTSNRANSSNTKNAPSQTATDSNRLPEITSEETRNAGLILLMLFAQAYYKLIECTLSFASWCAALDLELNESYLWTVSNITNLLKNHKGLEDFPIGFEPLFPDLYPSTIQDQECDDDARPAVEEFLATVQKYVHSKGTYDPEEKSPGWILVEMFRPGVNTAIERATVYNKRMKEYCRRLSSSPAQPMQGEFSKKTDAKPSSDNAKNARNRVFISYCHKDKKLLSDLRAHLRPLERAGRVYAWSDQQIKPGSQWFPEIQEAISLSKVAVLLVTKDFLASDFIHDHELGPLLKDARTGGVTILWVLLRNCNWRKTPLETCQAAFSTEKPLAEMKAERDSAWVAICDRIEGALVNS